LSEGAAAQAIEQAVQSVLADGPRTRDLGGRASTKEVMNEVIGRLVSAD